MPAEKSARVQERRRISNRRIRTSARTAVKQAIKATDNKENDAAQAVAKAVSLLDGAAGKGVVHKNNAARRKSRLMKRLSKASAAS